MNDNRYAAPAAAVADLDEAAITDRPNNVVIAVYLLWFQLAIGIPGMVYQVLNPSTEVAAGAMRTALFVTTSLIVIGSVALYAFLNWKCWQGRNWARIVHLIFLILGLVMIFWALRATFTQSRIQGVVYIVQMMLNVAAVVLLFTRPASAWYKALRDARR
jgi:Ca2+/H+ antiporter